MRYDNQNGSGQGGDLSEVISLLKGIDAKLGVIVSQNEDLINQNDDIIDGEDDERAPTYLDQV